MKPALCVIAIIAGAFLTFYIAPQQVDCVRWLMQYFCEKAAEYYTYSGLGVGLMVVGAFVLLQSVPKSMFTENKGAS